MKNKLIVAVLVFVFGAISAIAADGMYQVQDLYAKKAELKGKTVIVKGKVVKVSRGIMGKDWIHVQDGSANKEQNKVIFTTDMDSAIVPNDMVIATGVLTTDVDIGAGYFYSILVEKSTFKK